MKKKQLHEALSVLLTKLSSARDNPLLMDNYAVKALRTVLFGVQGIWRTSRSIQGADTIHAGYNICTIAEALHKTPTLIRKIKRVSSVFEKFSKAYHIALKEASFLNQCKG